MKQPPAFVGSVGGPVLCACNVPMEVKEGVYTCRSGLCEYRDKPVRAHVQRAVIFYEVKK